MKAGLLKIKEHLDSHSKIPEDLLEPEIAFGVYVQFLDMLLERQKAIIKDPSANWRVQISPVSFQVLNSFCGEGIKDFPFFIHTNIPVDHMSLVRLFVSPSDSQEELPILGEGTPFVGITSNDSTSREEQHFYGFHWKQQREIRVSAPTIWQGIVWGGLIFSVLVSLIVFLIFWNDKLALLKFLGF